MSFGISQVFVLQFGFKYLNTVQRKQCRGRVGCEGHLKPFENSTIWVRDETQNVVTKTGKSFKPIKHICCNERLETCEV